MYTFRKIDLKIYGDERFRRLSPPQPNAQTVFIYLLTGLHTRDGLPGLYPVSEMELTDRLGWPVEDFRRVWMELEASQDGHRWPMAKADWAAGVVWAPRGIFYNPPTAPNIVKSWSKIYRMIPECGIKHAWAESVVEFFDSDDGKRGRSCAEIARRILLDGRRPAAKRGPRPKPEERPSATRGFAEEAVGLAGKLRDLILVNDPKARVPKDGTASMDRWAADMDRLLRIDKRPADEAADVLAFSQADDFWKGNILSAGKFRKQYTQLLIKMRSSGKPGAANGKTVKRSAEADAVIVAVEGGDIARALEIIEGADSGNYNACYWRLMGWISSASGGRDALGIVHCATGNLEFQPTRDLARVAEYLKEEV